ncbi:SHOCT domain-containing protein [Thalassotalea sp. M1531]|uniref:SHOCT domain-containing protein n=1 Tax=Thalassotalea algicola TaxID=2716224 RepID=A0A7Y0LAA1_9GAMM|nr:SHOCT domain-containing protein [Thalassotalea algicola]NMP30554.1 SHOCT domain-containing protein [Thalassotalea algicola]
MNIFCKLLFIVSFLLHSHAFGFQVSIEQFANLSSVVEKESPVTIQPVLKQPNKFFIVNESGTILSVELTKTDIESSTTSFDAKKVFSRFIKLTAFSLHPNFNLRDQEGYLTFYTAHSETIDTKRKRARLLGNNYSEPQIKADSVIYEWKLDENLVVDLSTQREIIRIGSPNQENLIKQIAFNPNIKVWHEHFGQLYISLDEVKGVENTPLYSGAILRINPKQFGLKRYTNPSTNPYLNNNNIANEILVHGLNNLGRFFWSGRNQNQLVVDHYVTKQRQISEISFNSKASKANKLITIEQKAISPHQALSYQGKQLSYLYGALVIATYIDGQWQLQNMPHAADAKITTLWPLDSQNGVQLYVDHLGDLLVYNNDDKQLSKLINISIPGQEQSVSYQQQDNTSFEKIVVAFILLGIILWAVNILIKHFNKNKKSTTNFYHKQLTHIEFSSDKQVIHLFQHHKTAPLHSIHINDLRQCDILLNEHAICSLTQEKGMGNDLEQVVREAFNIEKREKMLPNKLRSIQLLIVDKAQKPFPIYLYIRKGDNRISKTNYREVCESIINWCWKLSLQLCPNGTEQRDTSALTIKTPPPNAIEKNKAYSSDKQAVSPVITKPKEAEKPIETKATQSASNFDNENQNSQKISEQALLDTKIIASLEKLARLRAENFLTEEEFEIAKAKLLQGL